MRIFHPCDYGFLTSNIRIVGNSLSGGTSLSGFEDTIETDGGGYRACDLTNGSARTREANLAIRALLDEVGTTQAMTVMLCMERHLQPVLDRASPPGVKAVPVADDAPDKGAAYTASASANLRATTMTISGVSEIPLQGGELFSVNHPTWGWRAYRIVGIDGTTIRFRTPLREAVASGTALEFDNPRCQMKFAQKIDLPMENGIRTPLSLTLVEDMRPPR